MTQQTQVFHAVQEGVLYLPAIRRIMRSETYRQLCDEVQPIIDYSYVKGRSEGNYAVLPNGRRVIITDEQKDAIFTAEEQYIISLVAAEIAKAAGVDINNPKSSSEHGISVQELGTTRTNLVNEYEKLLVSAEMSEPRAQAGDYADQFAQVVVDVFNKIKTGVSLRLLREGSSKSQHMQSVITSVELALLGPGADREKSGLEGDSIYLPGGKPVELSITEKQTLTDALYDTIGRVVYALVDHGTINNIPRSFIASEIRRVGDLYHAALNPHRHGDRRLANDFAGTFVRSALFEAAQVMQTYRFVNTNGAANGTHAVTM